MANLLVVDDDPDAALILAATLEAVEHTVAIVGSPHDAVARAIEFQPDLILLDVMMPELSGWDILELLHHHPLTLGIPVVMISALSDPAHRVRSLRAGASDFVVKPFDGDELLARVDRLVRPAFDDGTGLRGRLDVHPLCELLQSLGQHRRTGRVHLRSGASEGYLAIDDGKVAAAAFGGLEHSEAVWAVLALDSGSFVFTPGSDPAEPGGEGQPLQGLLLEAAWLEDELAKRQTLLPSSSTPLVLVSPPGPPGPDFTDLPFAKVSEFFERRGPTTLDQLAAELPLAPTRRRLVVALLVESGALRPGTAAPAELPARHEFDARLFAELAGGSQDRVVPITLLAEAGTLEAVRQFLEGLPPGTHSAPSPHTEVYEAERDGWRVRLTVCLLDLDRVFEVFRAAAASEAVLVWLDPDVDPIPIPLRLIQAAAGPRARLEAFLAPSAVGGGRRFSAPDCWRVSSRPPAGLAELVEAFFGSITPQIVKSDR